MPSFEISFEDGMREYEQAAAQGEMELEQLGFPSVQRPMTTQGELADRPNIPTNLSQMSMAELTDLMGYATEWYRYALEILPAVASEKNIAESARDFAWAKIRKSKDGTVSDKDNETRCDARYLQAAARFETCDYKYRRIKAISDGLEREVETISRAMSGLEYTNKVEGYQLGAARRAYRDGQGPRGERPSTIGMFTKKPKARPEE